MRPTRWMWILPLFLLGASLYAHFVAGLFAAPAPARSAQVAFQQQQPSATPATYPPSAQLQDVRFIYPLGARWQVESFFDHTTPCVDPDTCIDDSIAIYTGHAANPLNTPTPCYMDGGAVRIYSDGDSTATDLRWDQDLSCGVGGPGWLAYDGHAGYDFNTPDGTFVAAMQAGDMAWISDSLGKMEIRSSDQQYLVVFYHLSSPAGGNRAVYLGEHVANSGHAGTGAAHLHAEIMHWDGDSWEYIDPSGWQGDGVLWAGWSGGNSVDPIPMGYRDQAPTPTVHGPFELDNPAIRNKWLEPGMPRWLGSPLGHDYEVYCEDASLGREQLFERGAITFCDPTPAVITDRRRIFLPKVWASDIATGWNSTIYVRNLSPYYRATVSITFYSPAGWVLESRTYQDGAQIGLPAGATWEISAREVMGGFIKRQDYDPVFTGTAVVASNEDVAVMVRTENSTSVMAYTGVSTVNGGTGWGEPGLEVRAPVIVWRPYWGAWESTIHVQNTSGELASFDIDLYNEADGSYRCTIHGDLPAYGAGDYPPSGNCLIDDEDLCLLDPYEEPYPCFLGGSAYIHNATQPLAAVVSQNWNRALGYVPALGDSQYNAFAYTPPSTQPLNYFYLPSLENDWLGWWAWRSSITIQNVGSLPTTDIHIVYVRDNGVVQDVHYTAPLPANASRIIVQWDPTYGVPVTPIPATPTAGPTPTPAYGWHGVAYVVADQPVVAIVNQEVHDWPTPGIRVHQSYSSLTGGSNIVYGPFAADYYNAPTPEPSPGVTPYAYSYHTGSDVQNLDSASTDITSRYYAPEGSGPSYGRTIPAVPTLGIATFWVPATEEGVPNGWRGSMQVLADRTIAGILNIARVDRGSGSERDDFGASYNMPQRRDGLPPSSQVTALAPYHNIASFSVSWSGTDDLAGLASYDVQYRDGPGGAWTGWLTATTATAATFSGGQDAHGYYFRCRARDLVGNLEEWPPDYDATTTVDLTAPSSQVAALPTYSPASFALAWSGSDATSGVAAYDVEYRVGVTNTWSTLFFATQQTQTLFAGDQDGQTYYFHCRAQDYAGNQEAYPGTPDAFTTLDLSPPASSATAPAYDNASPIPVSWTAGDATSGVASTALWYRFNGGDWTDSGLSQAGPAGTFSFTPSAGDGTYYLATRATDNAGNQEAVPAGSGDDVTTYDTVLPSSAVNALPACSPAVFNVSWAGTDPSPSSGIQSYDVQTCTIDCALPDDAVWVDWLADTTQTTAAFSGAHGYPYYFRSRVRDNAGNQEDYYKNADASTVVDAIPPATAVNALPLDNPATTFTVTWSGSDNGCGLAHYDLYYRDESAADWTAWLTNEAPGPGQAPFNGTAGHTYYFCSRGTDLAGNVESCPPLGMGAGEWPIQGDTETRLRPWSRVNALPANPGTNVPGPWIAAPLGGWQKTVTVKVPVVAAQ